MIIKGEIVDLRVVAILVTVGLAWSGLLIGIIKWLLDRYQAHIDKRFESLEKAREDEQKKWEKARETEQKEWQRIERELLDFKAELPVLYVRREDNIRQEVIINAKLDALAKMIEALRGAK